MDKLTDQITFRFSALLVFIIIVSSLIIFLLTPSPISPTKRFFGYISNVYTQNGTVYLTFKSAQWFSDTKDSFPASTACVEDGNCPNCPRPITSSCTPRGYYIRNSDKTTVTYPVASFTKAGTLIINPSWNKNDPASTPYQTLSLSDFASTFQNPKSDAYWITSAPYDLTLVNNWVIIISQHYIP